MVCWPFFSGAGIIADQLVSARSGSIDGGEKAVEEGPSLRKSLFHADGPVRRDGAQGPTASCQDMSSSY
jgi:hypothetical protein